MSSIFRSIRFNVFLFLAIAALAAIGTLLPQTTDQPDQVRALLANHPFWAPLAMKLGLFQVYHSLLFAALLGLMAFDIILCKLVNRPPDQGLVPLPESEESEDALSLPVLRRKPFQWEAHWTQTPATAAQQLVTRFHSAGYKVRQVPLPAGGTALFASRHRLQRWGSYLSHISLVAILLGGMIKSLVGFDTTLPIMEGRSSPVVESLLEEIDHPNPSTARKLRHYALRRSLTPLAHWTLTVNSFSVDFYPGSTVPSTFASRVKLLEGDNVLAERLLRVNEPMEVNGIRFYQASWGVTGMIQGALLHIGEKTRHVEMRKPFPIPPPPADLAKESARWTARVEQYLPDFIWNPNGTPGSASLEWKNPALVIGYHTETGRRLGTLVVSAPSPVTSPDAEPWAYFVLDGRPVSVPPPLEVLAVRPWLFSGIQVTYDPGFPVIVGGVLAMLIGLCALFYLHQRRVVVLLRPEAQGTKLDAGAWSSRGTSEYRAEFHSFFESHQGLAV